MKFLSELLLLFNSFLAGISPFVPKFTEGVIGQPISFFPSTAQSKADVTISELIYRSLFTYDIYGTLIPELADTWEISDDGLVYTIKLKDNQYWTNGEKISSDDLIYSSFKIPNLAGVATDKVDELTVRYTLPNKYSPLLSLLTAGVMHHDAEEKDNPLNPISSGPFEVARVERSGPVIKSITLLHENPDQNIRKLEFRFYANEEEIVTAAKLGEIDAFVSLKDRELDNFEKYKFPQQGVYYALFFNLRNEKFQEKELRQNLEKALPLDDLTFDKGITVQGPISRSVFTDRDINFDKFTKELEQNYPELVVKVTVPDVKIHVTLAEQIESAWEETFGMDVQIETYDPDKIFEDVIKDRKFEILLYGQEIGRDPDRYVNWHSTQKDFPGLNLSGFEQVRADRALEEGRNESDNSQRVVHYNEFQKTVADEVPAIFLYHPFMNYYVSKYVSGIGEKYTFTQTDRFLDYDNWKRVKTN